MLSLCLHLSSLNLCHLISTVVVILFGLDCFINSVLVYFHIPHIHCLIISLNWYFVIWGSKRSRYFTHYLNIQLVLEWIHLFWFHYLSVILNPLCVLPWIIVTPQTPKSPKHEKDVSKYLYIFILFPFWQSNPQKSYQVLISRIIIIIPLNILSK